MNYDLPIQLWTAVINCLFTSSDMVVTSLVATGVARNFYCEGPKLEKIVTFFGDVMVITSQNDVITFLKFDFVIINLKYQNLAKSRNFKTPILKVKGRWVGEPLALGDF